MYTFNLAARRVHSLPQALQRSHADTRPLFEVIRQDDNANTFVIATGLCRAAAEAMVQDYTERGHKQVYWSRPITSAEAEDLSTGMLQSPNNAAQHNCK